MAWHFTPIGFFSVTCARLGEGRSVVIDKTTVMIRVRLVEHLKNLQEACAEEVPAIANAKIVVTLDNDYVARIFVPKTAWIAALSMLTDDMDYDNFKSAVARRKRDEYERSLHDIWGTMFALQHQCEPLLRERKAQRKREGSVLRVEA